MRAVPSILPLRLENLGYKPGQQSLLSDISLQFRTNRTFMLLGPNGAGKSLLLRLCHGLLEPTQGKVSWNLPYNGTGKQAMVFQRPVLLRRSARANLAHALSVCRVPRGAAKSRIDHVIERFGLAKLADKPARLLSGGEQQRLAIARAYALKPQVLFLDEPTAHLDPSATRIVEGMLREFRSEGITLIMATHDIAQVRRMADDIALLHRGRLIETGPADEFLSKPKTDLARAYLAGEILW